MNNTGIADSLGISPAAFERLLQGDVPDAIAQKLGGSTAAGLRRFIEGESSLGVAVRLRCSVGAVQELRNVLGREGAIGLLIGLCAPPPPSSR